MAAIRFNVEDLLYMVNESVNRIEIAAFKNKFDGYLKEAISEANLMLEKYGLSISVADRYNFYGKKWLAAYINSYNDIMNGKINIAINYPLMYSCMKDRGIENDDFNIEAQAKITTMHEAGHGIVNWLKLKHRNSLLKEIPDIKNSSVEEEIVEEFGQSFFPEATGVYGSKLENILDKLD